MNREKQVTKHSTPLSNNSIKSNKMNKLWTEIVQREEAEPKSSVQHGIHFARPRFSIVCRRSCHWKEENKNVQINLSVGQTNCGQFLLPLTIRQLFSSEKGSSLCRLDREKSCQSDDRMEVTKCHDQHVHHNHRDDNMDSNTKVNSEK